MRAETRRESGWAGLDEEFIRWAAHQGAPRFIGVRLLGRAMQIDEWLAEQRDSCLMELTGEDLEAVLATPPAIADPEETRMAIDIALGFLQDQGWFPAGLTPGTRASAWAVVWRPLRLAAVLANAGVAAFYRVPALHAFVLNGHHARLMVT
jgi:hypothetical protein